MIYCLFSAGIVFGFAAIKPVFIQEGVYRDRCTKKELEDNVEVCYNQELRLNLMFTIAAVGTNVCALPVGTVLDRYGPRVSGIISSVLLAAGCLLLAFAWDMKDKFDGYIAGYLLLALGGPFVFISSFQLSNTFPRYSGLILALLTGAFDTSSAVFLIYRLIYESTNGKFWPKKFFLAYLVVPAFILIVQVFIMPAQSYKTVSELVKQVEQEEHAIDDNNHDSFNDGSSQSRAKAQRGRTQSVVSEVTNLLGTKDGAEQAREQQQKQVKSGVHGAMHGRTVAEQVLSFWWILITLFTILQMLRINYFVATVRSQYTYLLNSRDLAIQINSFFDIALPLGGVVSIPFIGIILDNTSTTFVLGLLVAIATTIGVLGVLPYTWAAYANICLFVVYRPFYYTAVSDYASRVFGFATFGKVYGLIICLSGLFNFAQSGLDALTHGTFKNNPVPVNIILLVAAFVVGVALVGFVWSKSRSQEREELEVEAEEADEHTSLIPGADPRVRQDRHPVDVHADEGRGH